MKYAQTAGPTSASAAPQKTIATCGENDGTLISGGAAISGGNTTSADFTAPGAQGDHLNGSYPSDSGGTPAGNASTSATSWTSTTHTGGSGSSGDNSDSWALCLTGN